MTAAFRAAQECESKSNTAPLRKPRAAAWALVACAAAAGCSDEDEGWTPGPDETAPEVTVTYPMAHSCTDAGELSVRGQASDPAGVTHVRVNGIDVTTDDGFASWRVTLPLDLGDNDLQIDAQDDQGNGQVRSGEILISRIDTPWRSPDFAALDEAGGRILVADGMAESVFQLDGATGERQELSGPTRGSGPEFSDIRGLAYHPPSQRILVLDDGLDGLLTVDGSTGDRAILSDATHGTGAALDGPERITLDLSGNLAFVSDSVSRAIISIDLTTGDRAIVSSDTVGAGPPLGRPLGLAHDAVGARLLVTDAAAPAKVWSVSLASGDRTVLSDDQTGSGPSFGIPPSIIVDPTSTVAYVTDTEVGAVFQVDLVSGNRTLVSGEALGNGPGIPKSGDIVFDGPGGRLLVVDAAQDAVIAIDAPSGDRTFVALVTEIGSGPNLVDPRAATRKYDGTLVIDAAVGSIYKILDGSGDRELHSGPTLGVGPMMVNPRDLELDSADYRMYVVDEGLGALLAADYGIGDRVIISDATTGSGTPFNNPAALALDTPNDRVFVVDEGDSALISVTVSTGDRVTISSDSVGAGPSLAGPVDVTLDAYLTNAFVVSGQQGNILSVDLASGDRQELSSCVVDPQELRPTKDQIFVSGADGIVVVELSDGSCSPLSTGAVGLGPAPLGQNGFVYQASLDSLFVMSTSLNALIMVDRATGDRVIVAK